MLQAIAAGGMAEVYEVEDPASGERLALKLLQNLRVALKRFNREYEAMARLNHPGVVRVYHYGLYQGRPWLTMELLQGVNAHDWTKEFGAPGSVERMQEILRVGYHLATALHYVHDRGLVHRDLKSANVIVLPDARVKLVDFGTAHLVDAAERITREGEFVGTFAYASPEQLQGRRDVTPQTDLYALGVFLYRLVTGRRPFAARDPAELAWQHIHEAPPDPRSFVIETSAELAGLLMRLLAKEPRDRPADAGEVAATLERLAGRPFASRNQVAVHRPRSTSRHLERQRFWNLAEQALGPTVVAVVGDAGSDLDRVLGDLVADAGGRGWEPVEVTVRRGRDLATLTRCWLQLGRDLEDRAPIARAIDQLRVHARVERRTRADSRAAVAEAAAVIVEARARGADRGIALVLHGAHHVRGLAAEHLRELLDLLRRRGVPITVALGLGPEDVTAGRPLARLLSGAWEVWLEPLSAPEVAFAAGTMLGSRPPPAWLARGLVDATGGRPLYLESVVTRMAKSGELVTEDGRLEWSAHAFEFRPPPDAVADAERLIAELPVLQHRVLQAVAVAVEASTAVLAEVLGWLEEELVPVIEDLVRRGLLRWESAGTTQPGWGHPAAEEVVRSRLHAARRSRLRHQLVRVTNGGPPSAVQVRALCAVGRFEDAARVAGPVCRQLFDRHEVRAALRLLEPVVRGLGGRALPNQAVYADVFLLYSLALQGVNPAHPDTAKALGVARRLAERPPEMVARVQWGQARLARSIGHHRNHQKHVEEALATVQSDPAAFNTHAWLRIEQGDALRFEGASARALEAYRLAEQTGRALGDVRLVARATIGVAACQLDLGRLRDAESQASRAMAQLERLRDHHGFWHALAVWGQAMRRQGRYSDALAVLYQRAPEARHHEDPRAHGELLLALTWCELDLERLGRAQEYVDELAATTGRGEHLSTRLEASLANGRILLASGQPRQAAYVLQGVEHKARLADLRVLAELGRAWHAEALALLGDRDTARPMYQSALLGLVALGNQPALAEATISRSRALGRELPLDEAFRPMDAWLASDAPALVRLEELLARGLHLKVGGDPSAARDAYRQAAMILNRLATRLNDTDRAALRVHSWSRRIRWGLS